MSLQHLFDQRKKAEEEKEKVKCDDEFESARDKLQSFLNEGTDMVNKGGNDFERNLTLDNLVPCKDCVQEVDTRLLEHFDNNPYVKRNARDYSDSLHDWDRPVPPHRITWSVHIRDLKK